MKPTILILVSLIGAVNNALILNQGLCALSIECTLPQPEWSVSDENARMNATVVSDFWTTISRSNHTLTLPFGPIFPVYRCANKNETNHVIVHNQCSGITFLVVLILVGIIIITLIIATSIIVGLCITKCSNYDSL